MCIFWIKQGNIPYTNLFHQQNPESNVSLLVEMIRDRCAENCSNVIVSLVTILVDFVRFTLVIYESLTTEDLLNVRKCQVQIAVKPNEVFFIILHTMQNTLYVHRLQAWKYVMRGAFRILVFAKCKSTSSPTPNWWPAYRPHCFAPIKGRILRFFSLHASFRERNQLFV